MCTTMKLAIAFVCAAVAAEIGTADAGTASCDGRLLISSDNGGTAPTAYGLKLFATFKNPKTDGRTPKMSCAEENYLMRDANGKPVRWDRNKNGKHRFVLKNCWSDSYANAERKNYPTRPTFMTSESDCNAMLSELSTKLGLDSAGVLVVGSQNGGVHEWMVASDDCPAAAAAINAMTMPTTITTTTTSTTTTTTATTTTATTTTITTKTTTTITTTVTSTTSITTTLASTTVAISAATTTHTATNGTAGARSIPAGNISTTTEPQTASATDEGGNATPTVVGITVGVLVLLCSLVVVAKFLQKRDGEGTEEEGGPVTTSGVLSNPIYVPAQE